MEQERSGPSPRTDGQEIDVMCAEKTEIVKLQAGKS